VGAAEVWLWQGDITELEVDAIVNAANNQGWLGSGVAGAIRRGAGDEVEREAVAQAPWPVGDAVRTGPGRLAGATEAALGLAAAEGLASIALPALGTGVGGLDYPACARAMGTALQRHLGGGLGRDA
jgi:O-acetyl-ADP-ribose deacetylase (regulator of RNase III)